MKLLTGFLTLVALARVASAQILDVPADQPMVGESSLQATPLDQAIIPSLLPPVYSSIPGPYAAPAAGAFASRDDYTTNLAGGGNFVGDRFSFVGGVTAAGGILDFFFLDPANNVIDSFSAALPQGGNFLWTITGAYDAAKVGQFQIQTRTGSSGQWFLTTTPPSVGANSFAAGYGSPQRIGAFELEVPEPGAIALAGIAGLLACSRRRIR